MPTKLTKILLSVFACSPLLATAANNEYQPTELLFKGPALEHTFTETADIDGDELLDYVYVLRDEASDGSVTKTLYWVANQGGPLPFARRIDGSIFGVEFDNVESGGVVSELSEFDRYQIADINGDGNNDVVIFEYIESSNETRISAALNTGASPRFATPTLLSVVWSRWRDVQLIDIDNDNDLDFIGSRFQLFDYLFLNQGDSRNFGPLARAVDISVAISSEIYDKIFADFDNDGLLDVYVSIPGADRIYRNNGTARPFSARSRAFPVTKDSRGIGDVRLADLDNDGDIDIVTTNIESSGDRRIHYYLNAGPDRLFLDSETQYASEPFDNDFDNYSWMELGDFSGDGFVDIIAGDSSFFPDQADRVFVNGGADTLFSASDEVFIRRLESNQFGFSTKVAIADLDGDGDLDEFTKDAMFLNNGFNGKPMPVITVDDLQVSEAAGKADVTLRLNQPQTEPVSLEVRTVLNTAAPAIDYIELQEVLTFSPGETEKSVSVEIIDDDFSEMNENFQIAFSLAQGANISDPFITVTIVDDGDDGFDPSIPTLTIADLVADESAGKMEFVLRLDQASPARVLASVATVSGSAQGGSDFFGKSQDFVFDPGVTERSFTIGLKTDFVDEEDEVFTLNVYGLANARLGSPNPKGTILDAVAANASLELLTPSVIEGQPAQIKVLLSRALDRPVSVDFATSMVWPDNFALPGRDYYGLFTTIAFDAGETEQIVEVITLADPIVETEERFSVRLFNARNGITVDDRQKLEITILDSNR